MEKEKSTCAKCKKEFELDKLYTLEIANENFRKLADKAPGTAMPMYPECKILEDMGLDSSMIFCKDCKAALDSLIEMTTKEPHITQHLNDPQ